jgi:hypothetical protein
MVAGHGMDYKNVAEFGAKMASQTNVGLNAYRTVLKNVTENFFRRNRNFLFVKWNPYPALINGSAGQQPWFVWLPRSFPDRGDPGYQPPYASRWASSADMLAAITHTVLDDPAPGPGYQSRPTSIVVDAATNETVKMTDGVLLPLYLPFVFDNGIGPIEWTDFFNLRRSQPIQQPVDLFDLQLSNAAQNLNAVSNVSGDLPGLFVAGSELLPIQVLRPKVRP